MVDNGVANQYFDFLGANGCGRTFISVPKKHFSQYKTTAGLIITQRRLITGPQCENTGSNPTGGAGGGGTPFDGQIRRGFAQRGYIFQALRI